MATFGKLTPGAQNDEIFSNFKTVGQYVLSQAGSVSKLTIDCDGLGSAGAGNATLTPVIYRDNAGEPGALIASGTPQVVVHTGPGAGQARAQTDFLFAAPVPLAAGVYWIGFVHTAGNSQAARYWAAFVVGHGRSKSGGLTDPFGTPTATIDEDVAVFGTYAAITSGSSRWSSKWRFPGKLTKYWKN